LRPTIAFALAFVSTFGALAQQQTRVRHFAANANFDENGAFLPAKAGFDLADVSGRSGLDQLPAGTMGLVWVGRCDGVSATFESIVNAVIDHPRVFGFYLMDDPDPTGIWRPLCRASDLRAESDWIHRRRPDVVTFIALMNLGSSDSPHFSPEYAPQNSHVDLFSIAPYPCRIRWTTCDNDMIDRFVAASRNAGFPTNRLVPTYQTFGGGDWRSDGGGAYRLPDAAELQAMLDRWDTLAPLPAFDFAYAWGQQRNDSSLAASTELQAVLARHNRRGQ
jgi:hypothetical protein